jgi:DNA-binding MarR family transcriptional regulator
MTTRFTCEDFVGYNLKRASLVFNAEFNRALQASDVRPVVLSLLLMIARQPGITSSELGRSLEIQSSNMVGLIRDIRQKGWISHMAAVEDRRAKGLTLTAQGRALLLRVEQLAMQADVTATRPLTARERATLTRLLQKIVA